MSSINSNTKQTKQLLKSKTKRQNQTNESNKKQKSSKKNKNYFSEIENDEEFDSFKSSENDQDEDNSKFGKQENSLSQLTQNFLNYIKMKGRIRISINDLVEDLNVKKRRIYDITNVLQGIGYLEKKGKNEILWIKNNNTITIPNNNNNITSKEKTISENYISNYCQLKKEFDDLKSQNKEIADNLNKYREEFRLISQKNEFPKYGYITFDDIKDLSINEKVNFMLIKAPKGTLINVIDDEESKKAYNKIKTQMENGKIQKDEKLLNTLENLHHIFFTSQDKEIKIYKIEDGKIKQQLNEDEDNHNDKFLYQNFQNNISNSTKSYEPKININNNNINTNTNNNIIIKNQSFDKNYTEKNNHTIFNFDQFNIDNSSKKLNNKQIFNFDNSNIKQNLSNKKEDFTKEKNSNFGISSIFKK